MEHYFSGTYYREHREISPLVCCFTRVRNGSNFPKSPVHKSVVNKGTLWSVPLFLVPRLFHLFHRNNVGCETSKPGANQLNVGGNWRWWKVRIEFLPDLPCQPKREKVPFHFPEKEPCFQNWFSKYLCQRLTVLGNVKTRSNSLVRLIIVLYTHTHTVHQEMWLAAFLKLTAVGAPVTNNIIENGDLKRGRPFGIVQQQQKLHSGGLKGQQKQEQAGSKRTVFGNARAKNLNGKEWTWRALSQSSYSYRNDQLLQSSPTIWPFLEFEVFCSGGRLSRASDISNLIKLEQGAAAAFRSLFLGHSTCAAACHLGIKICRSISRTEYTDTFPKRMFLFPPAKLP